jgi:heat shock protein HslJ
MKRSFLIIALTAILLASCTPTGAQDDLLNGSAWILASLNGQPALAGVTVTLNFQDGTLGGSDGCNSYSGSYESSDSELRIGKEIISTMMACAEPVMEQASAFTTALTQAVSIQMDGDQLTLLDKDNQKLAVLTRQSRELAGTTWLVTGFNNGHQAVVSLLSGSQLTLIFNADGTLNGSAAATPTPAPTKSMDRGSRSRHRLPPREVVPNRRA